jgi:hypothetical protein
MAEAERVLKSRAFRQAVAGIQRRAEKQTDWAKLDQVFVRSDLFDRVQSPDSQLMLGRRGTGKTHLVRVFQQFATEHGQPAFYIDCTRLGSGYSGLQLPAEVIAQKYFLALLNQLGTELLDEAIRLERPDQIQQEGIVQKLSDGLVPQMREPDGEDYTSAFNYRQISDILAQVIDSMHIGRLFLILDEWAQVPLQAQPFLAEYLKRAILTVPGLSLKLLAVNYQCQFSKRQNGNLLGLERGADIPDVIDLDRYLVFDEKTDFVTSFFSQLLYNHLGIELGWNLDLSAEDKRRFVISQIFTQERSFVELVRAAEGNSRDFLCIFSRSYFDEFRRSSMSAAVSIPNVVAAAISWYDSEKASNVYAEPTARETLTYLMNHVLKGYKSRTFLVESSKAESPRLIRLLNERVLHRLNGTYSHPDRPGIRYDLFTVDYGAFVRFRGTVNQVREEVFWQGDTQETLTEDERRLMVPIDDRRSIRRITFDPDSMGVVGDRQLELPGV